VSVAPDKTDKKEATIERARQLADTGQYAQAIAVWRQLLDESPNDANVYNTIGDLAVKSRANAEAIDAYNKAARFFLQEGFHLKAIAVYKKILKLEPARAEIYTLLGDLNVVRGLMNNAIADYLSSAKLFLNAAKTMNALTLFRKIAKVDPQNTDVRLRVAELCLKENLQDVAIEEYLCVGKEFQRQGRGGEARTLYDKILKLTPGHAEARRRLDTPYQPELEKSEPVTPESVEMTIADVVQEETVEGGIELSLPESTLSAPLQPAPGAEGTPGSLSEARRLLGVGDLAGAERMVRAFLLEDPDQREYQAVLGLVYLKKGQLSPAYDILYPISKAWLTKGRREEASDLIDAYLMAEPDDDDFLQLKARVTQEPAAEKTETPSPKVTPAEVRMPPVLQVEPAVVLAEEAVPAAAAGMSAGGLDPDVEALFQEFRKRDKAHARDGKYETHYDLGVAYKEMDLLAEAIEEFQQAACGPTRFVDACAMIAACYKSQRRNTTAIALLERALADPRCVGPGGPYVKYDLAVLYEEEGLTDKAARLFTDIPSIGDAQDRLDRLRGGPPPAGQSPAQTKRPVSYL
jgi:tetratricopeptide (TPR) repeat protein